ncbi:cell envelope biogenesis protein OmpA [Nonlabens dokdonensis]|uniref:cell envelope biogenesis protein OmpA n=1 Tax=Nonlabens dokdonensis TaxID=328515 RepID=UPI002689630B
MKLKTNLLLLATVALTLSCVSKKKYVSLENDYNNTKSELLKSRVESEDLQRQMEQIQMRVQRYNEKIASLNEDQKVLKDNMLVSTDDRSLVLSAKNKEAMRRTLENVPAYKLAEAKTLKDSLNLAISHNMMQSINGLETGKDLNVSIEESVVMINIDDNLLFKDSSYRIGNDADDILAKIAKVVNSEPSLEVLVEGHTDNRTVKEGSYVKDN